MHHQWSVTGIFRLPRLPWTSPIVLQVLCQPSSYATVLRNHTNRAFRIYHQYAMLKLLFLEYYNIFEISIP